MPAFENIRLGAPAYREQLIKTKRAADVDFPWYPYSILANFDHVAPLVSLTGCDPFPAAKTIADFGAADGDLSFYLESLQYQCTIFDYGPTNMNGLRGARYLNKFYNYPVAITEIDLDSQFRVSERYDVIFFLGILYHLKNPFYALDRLSYHGKHLFLSTRVARHLREGREDVSDLSCAYLLGPRESNNDATNFWIFTAAGVERLVARTGWRLLYAYTVGSRQSNPQDNDKDERLFALLESVR